MLPSSNQEITLDTIKIMIPDYVPDYRSDYFLHHNGFFDRRAGQTTGIHETLTRKTLGLSMLRIYPYKTEIEFSAKILKKDYRRLNSENTIEQSLGEINRTGFVRLDINKVLDRAIVRRCDVTRDIHLENDVEHYIQSLSHISTIDPRYTLDRNTSGKTGLAWNRSGRSGKTRRRFTLYGKEAEIKTAKPGNKELREFVQPSDFKNVLRFEDRETNFENMRELFSLEDGPPLLRNVLSSQVNPYVKIFDSVFPSSNQVGPDSSLSDYEGMKASQAHRLFFLKMLLREHGNIERALSVHLKRLGGNSTRLRIELREIENESKPRAQRNNENAVLSELREKLLKEN